MVVPCKILEKLIFAYLYSTLYSNELSKHVTQYKGCFFGSTTQDLSHSDSGFESESLKAESTQYT